MLRVHRCRSSCCARTTSVSPFSKQTLQLRPTDNQPLTHHSPTAIVEPNSIRLLAASSGRKESITSIIRGDTQLNFVPVSTALELINTNKLRAIAVISPQRIATLPNTPTFAESGLLDFTYNAWFGLFAPTGTPKPSLLAIVQATARILALPDIKNTLAQQGVDIDFAPSEQFDRVVKTDAERFGKMLSK
jgi:tripartite-type tricarboxylate transporter receptor subunit TctC